MVTTAYFDTSALLKQYVTETGSPWVRAYLVASPAPTVFVSSLTLVEATCAFARRFRDGSLTSVSHDTLVRAFEYDITSKFRPLAVVPQTITTARRLATQHPLRAYDAVQLATAWLLNRDLLDDGQTPLTFVCADERLAAIAQAENLLTENPNQHL